MCLYINFVLASWCGTKNFHYLFLDPVAPHAAVTLTTGHLPLVSLPLHSPAGLPWSCPCAFWVEFYSFFKTMVKCYQSPLVVFFRQSESPLFMRSHSILHTFLMMAILTVTCMLKRPSLCPKDSYYAVLFYPQCLAQHQMFAGAVSDCWTKRYPIYR